MWSSANCRLSRDWNDLFDLLIAYKEEHGHCAVPLSTEYHGVRLGRWVNEQRCSGRSGQLSKDRVARLNGIGFVWDTLERQRSWEETFELLQSYKEEHGHCRVLGSAEYRGVKLGSWVGKQRYAGKLGKLSKERVALLNEIGFQWVVYEKNRPWDEVCELLMAYREENGHCNVPQSAEYGGVNLGTWVGSQRQACKNGKLSEARQARLNAIGFTWVAGEIPRAWDESFELLKAYKEEHGHCVVPSNAEYRGVTLGSWVAHQRRARNSDRLREDRVARLQEIGFCWNPKRRRYVVTQSDGEEQERKRARLAALLTVCYSSS